MYDSALFADLGYQPCHYGTSKILFRGPQRQLRGDYLAFIGGTNTFGPLIESPFPDRLEKDLGLSGINLGCRDAGIDVFNASNALIDICSMASATVIQILGAANMSNRFYTVDPRHNGRFVRAAKSLKAIYPTVDFRQFSETTDLLHHLAKVNPDQLNDIRYELQTAWVGRMRTLLNRIEGPKVLLWLSDHLPYSAATGGTICRDPVFIDRAMLNAVRNYADGLVEVLAYPSEINQGLVPLAENAHAVEERVLGPRVHDRVRKSLQPVLSDMIDTGRNIFCAAPQLATG